MKNFAKLLVLALAVAMVASMFAFSVSAAPVTEPGADPTKLVPGSDKVIFIKDAPRDENYKVVGELEGDGTGSDANNPLKPADHEDFDPSADYPKYHLTTAFYQATEMLAETGGTIVICGPVYFGELECWGSGSSVRDVFTAKFQNNVIKFTSVWDGVDYRETADAKMIVEAPAMVSILGSSIWENMDIATVSSGRAITFDEYCTYVGEGIKCYPTDEAFEGVNTNYISLGAGHRYAKSTGENPTLTVMSGTYNYITGGMWGTVASASMEEANVNLTIGGTTTVLGQIFGTVQNVAPFSGHVNITINGGTFECDINAVGPTGMGNTDGIATLKINGGDFKNAWSINTASMGATNNMPAVCTVDFTGWAGEDIDLAFANSIITDITDVKLPEGKTVEYLEGLIASYKPEATEPAETEPEATEPAGTEPTGTEPTGTEPDATEPEVTEPEVTSGDNTGDDAKEEEGGSNMILWIAIAAGVVVVVVIVVIVLKKKKA